MNFGPYKRERAPFVLTPEFVFVMGDRKSQQFDLFVDLCCKGYNLLRKYAEYFIMLFKLMISADLPQLNSEKDLEYLVEAFSMGLSDEKASKKFAALIEESIGTITTRVNNFIHNMAHPNK